MVTREVSTLRTYDTSMLFFQDVIDVVEEDQSRRPALQQIKLITKDVTPEGGLKLLTFRFKKYPGVCIQISPDKCILMLQGMKPDDYLSDLRIIRELVVFLRELYSNGLDFKLRKNTYDFKFKNEIISGLKAQIEFLEHSILLLKHNPKQYDEWFEQGWKRFDDDVDLHNLRAEGINSALARSIIVNGFRCKPDGTLKLKLDYQKMHKHQLYFKSEFPTYWDLLKKHLKYVTRFLDS